MRHFTLGFSIVLSALVIGCGGSVVFIEDDGSGDGGANDGGFGQGTASEGASPPSPPSAGGAPPEPPGTTSSGFNVPQTQCGIACDVLFQCGLEPASADGALCPGFEPSDQEAFSNFCVPQCEDVQAVLSLINGQDCAGTVSTISSVSAAFDDLCAFGF